MRCLSTEEIIERAQKKIIPLDSQEKTVQNIAALLSLHLKRLNALEEGVDTDFLPCFSELIIAPTGSGKTYLISKLAEAAGLLRSLIRPQELPEGTETQTDPQGGN